MRLHAGDMYAADWYALNKVGALPVGVSEAQAALVWSLARLPHGSLSSEDTQHAEQYLSTRGEGEVHSDEERQGVLVWQGMQAQPECSLWPTVGSDQNCNLGEASFFWIYCPLCPSTCCCAAVVNPPADLPARLAAIKTLIAGAHMDSVVVVHIRGLLGRDPDLTELLELDARHALFLTCVGRSWDGRRVWVEQMLPCRSAATRRMLAEGLTQQEQSCARQLLRSLEGAGERQPGQGAMAL